MPAEHTLLQQQQPASEEHQVDPFDALAAVMPKGRMAGKQLLHGQALVDAQRVEHRGLGPGIGAGLPAEYPLQAGHQLRGMGGRPLGHLQGERQQHEGVTHHRRVERVFAYAAVDVLAQAHGSACGDQGQPPGGIGRQCQRQQCCADQCAAVLQAR
ncbi:hypothetical protein D3C81_1772900 [compost metagenome]